MVLEYLVTYFDTSLTNFVNFIYLHVLDLIGSWRVIQESKFNTSEQIHVNIQGCMTIYVGKCVSKLRFGVHLIDYSQDWVIYSKFWEHCGGKFEVCVIQKSLVEGFTLWKYFLIRWRGTCSSWFCFVEPESRNSTWNA